MKKHKNIPKTATWNKEDKEWEQGEKDKAGKNIGVWNNWHEDGHLCGITDYGNGNPPFLFKRFHPDGTLAQEGNWHGGQIWLGTFRFINTDKPTPEGFPKRARENGIVWIAEFDYITPGIYNAQRYYDKKNRPVSVGGAPLPKRAAPIPERAFFVDEQSNKGRSCWVTGDFDTRLSKYVGDYAEWDLTGKPTVKRLYNRETGEVQEEHTYENGKLWSSLIMATDGKTQIFYHTDTDLPVVSQTILYRNNEKDRTTTFFNEEGRELYSVRYEKVSEWHERRYYNSELVHESIQDADETKAPIGVRYFYKGGAIMIDYTTNGDGTGWWRMYDKAGQEVSKLAEMEEQDKNEYRQWNPFMMAWASYREETTHPDWETIPLIYNQALQLSIEEEKISKMEVPAHLQAELKKVNWKKIETTMGDGESLPVAINCLLSTDEAIAKTGEDRILRQIGRQSDIYEATYKVATITARMIPFYNHEPVIQLRLAQLVFDVLGMFDIGYNKKLYNELITSLQPVVPLLLQMATSVHEVTAMRALYTLIHAGQSTPETEDLYKQTLQNSGNSIARRAYTAYSLGNYYILTKQTNKLLAEFSEAIDTEKDDTVRLVMAIQLVTVTKKEAKEPWLAILLDALINPGKVEYFNAMVPFIGEFEMEEYVMMMLNHASKEALTHVIKPVIDVLAEEADPYEMITLFEAIFIALFPTKADLKTITPVRKDALLVIADVVDKHPDFVNHKNVFDQYNLPHDSFKLKQLAAKADKK